MSGFDPLKEEKRQQKAQAELLEVLEVYPKECVVIINYRGIKYRSDVMTGEEIRQNMLSRDKRVRKQLASLSPGQKTNPFGKTSQVTIVIEIENVEGMTEAKPLVREDKGNKRDNVKIGWNIFAGRPYKSEEERELFAPFVRRAIKQTLHETVHRELNPEEARAMTDLPPHLLRLCK